MELVEFLEARISEDEEVARAVGSPGSDGHWHAVEYDYEGLAVLDGPDEGEERYAERSAATAHITRWDPVRVLAECAAKRRLVELHRSAGAYLLGDVDGPRQAYCATCGSGEPYEYPTSWPCETLRLLAAPYAEHPDYPEATQ